MINENFFKGLLLQNQMNDFDDKFVNGLKYFFKGMYLNKKTDNIINISNKNSYKYSMDLLDIRIKARKPLDDGIVFSHINLGIEPKAKFTYLNGNDLYVLELIKYVNGDHTLILSSFKDSFKILVNREINVSSINLFDTITFKDVEMTADDSKGFSVEEENGITTLYKFRMKVRNFGDPLDFEELEKDTDIYYLLRELANEEMYNQKHKQLIK